MYYHNYFLTRLASKLTLEWVKVKLVFMCKSNTYGSAG